MTDLLPSMLRDYFDSAIGNSIYGTKYAVGNEVNCSLVHHIVHDIDPLDREEVLSISLYFEYANAAEGSKSEVMLKLSCLYHLDENMPDYKDDHSDRTFTLMLIGPVFIAPPAHVDKLQIMTSKLNNMKSDFWDNICNNNIFSTDTGFHASNNSIFYISNIPITIGLHNEFMSIISDKYKSGNNGLSDNLVHLIKGYSIYKYLQANYLCQRFNG